MWTLNGNLVYSAIGDLQMDARKELGQPHSTKVIMDISEVGLIDSTGMGLLVSSHKLVRSRNGAFCLVNPPEVVRKEMAPLGLLKIFTIYATLENAMEAMRSS